MFKASYIIIILDVVSITVIGIECVG